MTLSTLDWIVMISFFLLIVGVGLSYSRQGSKNLESFFLGGRNLPWYIAGLSMVATTFAADTPLAVTELVGESGIAGNWLWWNMLAGGMLTTFFFARLWRRAGVLTEVELCELRYAGKPASFLRGFKSIYLGLMMNVVVIAWVNTALMSLLEVFFNASPQESLILTAGAMLFVAIYSSVSGLLGIVMTDVIQFCIAMTGCIILAVITVNEVGGITELKSQIEVMSPTTLNFLPTIGAVGSGSNLALSVGAFFAYAGVQWWASWYPGNEPGGGGYIAQRMMSTKTPKDSVYATLFFQVAHYCLRPWPWIIVALCVLVLYPDIPEGDFKLGYVYAMRDYLPSGLKGLLLVSFFAAYMSTISTQLNWGASYIVNDLYLRFIQPNANDKEQIKASRITTFIIMVIGIIVTTQVDTISGAWKFIMECGAGLGLVLILRWYWWRINAWSEITAMLTPFAVFTVITIMKMNIGPDVDTSTGIYQLTEFPGSFFTIVIITTVSWITVTFLTPPTNEETLKHFYNKVRPDGNWPFELEPVLTSGPENSSVLDSDLIKSDHKKGGLPALFMCWISAVVFAYSMLFLIGKTILMEWSEAGLLVVIAIVAMFSLKFFIDRTRIFED